MANTNRYSTTRIAFIGVMAAIIVVVTFFRFPLLGSKVHFANAMCLLAGLLLGPVGGGLAAGIGSFLYDILFGGYDVVQGCITFVSKFSMAWICAMLGPVPSDRPQAIACHSGQRGWCACLCSPVHVENLCLPGICVWLSAGCGVAHHAFQASRIAAQCCGRHGCHADSVLCVASHSAQTTATADCLTVLA